MQLLKMMIASNRNGLGGDSSEEGRELQHAIDALSTVIYIADLYKELANGHCLWNLPARVQWHGADAATTSMWQEYADLLRSDVTTWEEQRQSMFIKHRTLNYLSPRSIFLLSDALSRASSASVRAILRTIDSAFAAYNSAHWSAVQDEMPLDEEPNVTSLPRLGNALVKLERVACYLNKSFGRLQLCGGPTAQQISPGVRAISINDCNMWPSAVLTVFDDRMPLSVQMLYGLAETTDEQVDRFLRLVSLNAGRSECVFMITGMENLRGDLAIRVVTRLAAERSMSARVFVLISHSGMANAANETLQDLVRRLPVATLHLHQLETIRKRVVSFLQKSSVTLQVVWSKEAGAGKSVAARAFLKGNESHAATFAVHSQLSVIVTQLNILLARTSHETHKSQEPRRILLHWARTDESNEKAAWDARQTVLLFQYLINGFITDDCGATALLHPYSSTRIAIELIEVR